MRRFLTLKNKFRLTEAATAAAATMNGTTSSPTSAAASNSDNTPELDAGAIPAGTVALRRSIGSTVGSKQETFHAASALSRRAEQERLQTTTTTTVSELQQRRKQSPSSVQKPGPNFFVPRPFAARDAAAFVDLHLKELRDSLQPSGPSAPSGKRYTPVSACNEPFSTTTAMTLARAALQRGYTSPLWFSHRELKQIGINISKAQRQAGIHVGHKGAGCFSVINADLVLFDEFKLFLTHHRIPEAYMLKDDDDKLPIIFRQGKWRQVHFLSVQEAMEKEYRTQQYCSLVWLDVNDVAEYGLSVLRHSPFRSEHDQHDEQQSDASESTIAQSLAMSTTSATAAAPSSSSSPLEVLVSYDALDKPTTTTTQSNDPDPAFLAGFVPPEMPSLFHYTSGDCLDEHPLAISVVVDTATAMYFNLQQTELAEPFVAAAARATATLGVQRV